MKQYILLLLLIQQVTALNISVILDDNVTVEDYIVTHRVSAFADVENVSILDYYPKGVILHGIRLKEEMFIGDMRNVARLPIGNMSANQVATVWYQILEGSGEVLLGADIYYLEGEKHQLYPKNITISVKKEAPVSTSRFLIYPFAVIILLMILMHLKQKRKKRALY